MDILSFILGYNKGKAQSGESADDILNEIDDALDDINGEIIDGVKRYLVEFYDGETKVHEEEVVEGGSSTYKYTKDDYILTGWSLTNGGEVDENALVNITENRTVYAVWIDGVDFATVSWSKISEISRMGVAEQTFNLGDTRKETLTYSDGTTEEIELQIVAIGRDTTEDGTPTITLVPKNLLSKLFTGAWTGVSNYLAKYTISKVNTHLVGTVLPALSSDLQSVLQTACPTAYSDDHSTVTTRGNISLLDYTEIGLSYDGSDYSNAISTDNCLYGFSNTNASRIRTTADGTAMAWWELSADGQSTSTVYYKKYVDSVGNFVGISMTDQRLAVYFDMSVLFKICV